MLMGRALTAGISTDTRQALRLSLLKLPNQLLQEIHAGGTQEAAIGPGAEHEVALIKIIQGFRHAFFKAGRPEDFLIFLIII